MAATTLKYDDIQPEGNAVDSKDIPGHVEQIEMDVKQEDKVIVDTEAVGYIDPNMVITPAENRRLLKKIYTHLVPFLCIAYITQALDKGTLGTASIMGWQANVGAVGQDYALTTTYLYLGLAVGEPITNQIARRYPMGRLLGMAMYVWTALLIAQTFTLSVPPIQVIRVLLGFFEAFFHPCLMGITVQWFRKTEQVFLITLWQSMFALSNLVSNLLAYGFYQISGNTGVRASGLYTWQWMSVCIAVISTIAATLVILFLPDSPARARWLSEEDKVKVIERVRSNDQGIKQPKFRKEQAYEILRDPIPWLLVIMVILASSIAGGIGTFQNLLINQAFGFTVSQTQLLGCGTAVFQMALYLSLGALCTKTGQTIYCILGYVAMSVINTIVIIVVTPSPETRGGLVVSFLFLQCIQAANPAMWSLLARNIAGQSKRSVAYGMFFGFGVSGSIIAPQIFQSIWAPRYLPSLYIHLGLYAVYTVVLLLIRFILARRNRLRDEMMIENKHEQAFDDLTDIQNKEFRYSY